MTNVSPSSREDHTTKGNATPTISDDLLRGADEIAEFVFGDRRHRRKIYYLTSNAKRCIPYFKLGSVTCARKSSLLRWVEEQEGHRAKHHTL